MASLFLDHLMHALVPALICLHLWSAHALYCAALEAA